MVIFWKRFMLLSDVAAGMRHERREEALETAGSVMAAIEHSREFCPGEAAT